MPLLLLASVYE
uniref:Uncharacterized protein n=1 Tax=Anguilla anguilla TaxID=7936 RepID=A0A0E9XGI4_ANGAN